ncbi:hypothetical protein NL676_002936 [Syzygium grande]|nr:hypothetical protein NL676_002936 [Syzygium grande]
MDLQPESSGGKIKDQTPRAQHPEPKDIARDELTLRSRSPALNSRYIRLSLEGGEEKHLPPFLQHVPIEKGCQ